MALSGEGPPLFPGTGLPDQGKHLFAYIFAAVILAFCCVLCIMQHGHTLLVLCFLKMMLAVGCCCFPRLKAWVEEQSAAGGPGGEEDSEESPLLRPPFKKL